MSERVLVVEDRENLRAVLARSLAPAAEVIAVGSAEEAMPWLDQVAVVVSDVRLPGMDGHALLAAARKLEAPPEVVLMTAYAEIPAAVAALKAGAYDYLAKPVEPADLLRIVRRAAERHALVGRTRALEAALVSQEGTWIGRSRAMLEIHRQIERVGPLPVPVLLSGEGGTGKEIIARELHRVRGRGAFVAVSCGAVPEALLEVEVFGAARGAGERPGLLEAAAGGTLFLDEVSELPPGLQAKLHRALEEGEFRRVGEASPRPMEARIVAATQHDLESAGREGRFRMDLYWRLKVVQLALPPLRERREDIPLFAARFLQMAAARFGVPLRRLSPDALALLEAHPWPGNVRELRHAMEHAAVMAEGPEIEPAHLPLELRAEERGGGAPIGTYRAAVEAAAAVAGREYLSQLLKRTLGNVTRAALEAGMERETLHRLLRRHGLDAARFR